MGAWGWVLGALACIGLPSQAACQGAGGQGPFSVDGTANLEVVQARLGPTNPVRVRVEYHIAVSGNKVSGSVTRNVMSKGDNTRVVLTDHAQLSGQLGQVGQLKADPGYVVAILSGNTLTVLQTLKAGAIKFTIRLGAGCSARIEHAREVGKGNSQRKGLDGQDIEITGWRQVSSSCRLARG